MCQLKKKLQGFLNYLNQLETKSLSQECSSTFFACPCCNYRTLPERGSYFICFLCNWEDDGQDEPYENEVWGGANGTYSLIQARKNFAKYLTMYSPEDKEMFEENTKKIDTKKLIIEKFKKLNKLLCKDSCIKLKEEIKNLKEQLY